MTSPMPGETRERQRIGARGDADAGHLGEPAGHQPGLAVVAEAQAVGRAGGDRDDVLERAAQLHAEHVAGSCTAGTRGGEPGDDPVAERRVLRRDDRGCRQALRRSPGRGSGRRARRSGEGRWVRLPAARIRDDLGHPEQRPFSRPLTTDRTSADAGTCARDPLDRGTQVRGRHSKDHQVGRALEGGGIGSRARSGPAARCPGGVARCGASPRSRPPTPASGSAAGPARCARRAARASCPMRRRRRPRRARGLPVPSCSPARARAARQRRRGRGCLPPALGRPRFARPPRRRGIFTDARSRNTSRIGVPRKPNCLGGGSRGSAGS